MGLSDRIIEASREAAQRSVKVIGIVSQGSEMFAVSGDVALVAAAVQESACPHHALDGGFHGAEPWLSVRSYEWPRVARVLNQMGFFPSVVELPPEPKKAGNEPEPFDSAPARSTD